jgi:predicted MPP superfamily phosphohydrolase
MSTIAIGDIHGNVVALAGLLEKISPDLAPTDVVVFLGDYIDRGPDTKRCVDEIIAFRDRAAASVVCLRGNHEDLDASTPLVIVTEEPCASRVSEGKIGDEHRRSRGNVPEHQDPGEF